MVVVVTSTAGAAGAAVNVPKAPVTVPPAVALAPVFEVFGIVIDLDKVMASPLATATSASESDAAKVSVAIVA
jgi:hypothetical protein